MAEIRLKQLCVQTIKTGVLTKKEAGTVEGEDLEIFGLSEDGKVFRYIWKNEVWYPLPMRSE